MLLALICRLNLIAVLGVWQVDKPGPASRRGAEATSS